MIASNFPLIKVYKYLSLGFVLVLFALIAYGISTLSSDEISNEKPKSEENSLLSSVKMEGKKESTHVVLLQENIYRHLRKDGLPVENVESGLEGRINIFNNPENRETDFPKAGDIIQLKGRCLGVDTSGAIILDDLRLIK